MIVVSNPGKIWLLKLLLKDVVPADYPFYLGLWKNNIVPDDDTTLADLGRATYAGYAEVPIARTGWTNPTVTASVAQSVWGNGLVAFASTAGTQRVYGWMMLDPTDSLLLWSERYTTPVDVSPTNPAYVLPLMRLLSEH